MRRVVTAFVIVMVASALAACGAAPADTTGTTGTPAAAGVPAAAAAAAPAAPAASADIYSPTQTVTPGELFPTDASTVPSAVLAVSSTKVPMLVFWYDPTSKVTADQRSAVKATIKKYSGSIRLVSLDYTVGLASGVTSATLDAQTQKVELLAAALNVKTTPYILFVDRYGRIVYRFAGYVDSMLLNREALRAIQ
jgi:hypothetical protein